MRLLATFNVSGEELRAALKWPNFIVNIEKIVQLAEEDAGNSPDGGALPPLTLEEAYRMWKAGTRRARITLEDSYRRVVSVTPISEPNVDDVS
jgi:hypothetical protein